jgi:hypothetical protein
LLTQKRDEEEFVIEPAKKKSTQTRKSKEADSQRTDDDVKGMM